MATAFEYSCGEDLTIALDITGGDSDISDVATVVAHLRKGSRGVRTVDRFAELIATFTVTQRVPAVGENPGWDLLLPAATTENLVPGYYLVDALITLDSGAKVITDQLLISLIPAVTRV